MRSLIRRTLHWRSVCEILLGVFWTLLAITVLYAAVLYAYF